MKRLRMHYTDGYRCSTCGQVYASRPRTCLNCGSREFTDLRPAWRRDKRAASAGDMRLGPNGEIIEGDA